MIWHVVIIKPKADLPREERQAFVDAFKKAVLEIPVVRETRIGRRLRIGAGYETAMPDADFMISIAFDDLPGLQAYLLHPVHRDLGERFYQVNSFALAYDFESIDWEDLDRLV